MTVLSADRYLMRRSLNGIIARGRSLVDASRMKAKGKMAGGRIVPASVWLAMSLSWRQAPTGEFGLSRISPSM